MANRYLPLAERFWMKVNKTDSCWLWTGSRSGYGYGRFTTPKGQQQAHRVAYELVRGVDLPWETTLDHLCMVKLCVNPDHLDPCSRGENSRRYVEKVIVACRQGHPFDPENTHYKQNGRRVCKACDRERWHRRRGNVPSE